MLRGWTANMDAQLRELSRVGWPVDVLSVHSYPMATEGPTARVRLLKSFKAKARALGRGSTPIWDTETNFGEERPGYPTRTYSGAKAAALVAQAYLDSFRYGIQRTYWYSWDTRFLGIDLTDISGRATTAAHGLSRLRTWLVGYRWNGCSTKRGVTRCRVPSTTGAKRTVVFARSTTTKLRMPTGATSVCSLNGRCRTVKAGKRITVGMSPRLVVGGRL
jgi:hypothetical protein